MHSDSLVFFFFFLLVYPLRIWLAGYAIQAFEHFDRDYGIKLCFASGQSSLAIPRYRVTDQA